MPLASRVILAGAAWLVGAATLFFVIAGTPDYWQGWAVLAVSILGSIPVDRVMLRDRDLLKRRTSIKERERGHMLVQVAALFVALFAFFFSALDHRESWSHVPIWLCILGDACVLAGCLTQYLVLKENRFASATIEIAPDQRVISTGIYGYVRHPWYVALLLLYLGLPLALGSFWALLGLIPILAAIFWRIRDEERFLVERLPGYDDYLATVRWRIVPGLY